MLLPLVMAVAEEFGHTSAKQAILLGDEAIELITVYLCGAATFGACMALREATGLLSSLEVKEWIESKP